MNRTGKTIILGLDKDGQVTMRRQVLADISFLQADGQEATITPEWFDTELRDQYLWFAENYPHLQIHSAISTYVWLGFEVIKYERYVDFDDADAWMHYQLVYNHGSQSNGNA